MLPLTTKLSPYVAQHLGPAYSCSLFYSFASPPSLPAGPPITQTGKPVPSSGPLPIPGHPHVLLHPTQLSVRTSRPQSLSACAPAPTCPSPSATFSIRRLITNKKVYTLWSLDYLSCPSTLCAPEGQALHKYPQNKERKTQADNPTP